MLREQQKRRCKFQYNLIRYVIKKDNKKASSPLGTEDPKQRQQSSLKPGPAVECDTCAIEVLTHV